MDNRPKTGKGKDVYLEILKSAALPKKLTELRQKLYQKAKNEPKFRFYTLYAHIYRDDTLQAAWKLVKRNKGASGMDGVSIADVERAEGGVEGFLKGIQEDLRLHRYKPGPVRRVYIPKADGSRRPLGIPNVRDRVIQAAARLILEPIFEADFKECSYGFRPGKSPHDALSEVREHLNAGLREVYDIDIQGYFDSIPHDKLLVSIEQRVADRPVVKLVRMWLKAPVIERGENGQSGSSKPTKGTPQGGVISPLLANIYLHWMDKLFCSDKGPAQWANARLVRFADDLVILAHYAGTRIERFAKTVLEERLGLTLHPDKTKTVKLKDGQAFDFLGFTFRYDRDLKGRPKRYLNITPSKKSLKRERARIKEMTGSKQCFKPITVLVKEINEHLADWKPYYEFGYPRKAFRDLNSYVRSRLVIHLRRRSQRPFRPQPGVSWYECLNNFGLKAL